MRALPIVVTMPYSGETMINNQNLPQIIAIREAVDIVKARSSARQLAARLGFSIGDQTRLATAVSELTRNILQYAGQGECQITDLSNAHNINLEIIIEDHGPGIPDIEQAMIDGFSTSGGLGAGLPGSRRLMDYFDIHSTPGHTTVKIGLLRRKK